MSKGRMEAFSDGVMAVIITIMVLEMKSPHGTSLAALWPLVPVFLSLCSELRLRRNLLEQPSSPLACSRACRRWDSLGRKILWHLLFLVLIHSICHCLDGRKSLCVLAVALYGIVLLLTGAAYVLLVRRLIAHHGKESKLAASIGNDRKGKASLLIYFAAIPLSFRSLDRLCLLHRSRRYLADPRLTHRKERSIGSEQCSFDRAADSQYDSGMSIPDAIP